MKSSRAVIRTVDSLDGELITPKRHMFKFCTRPRYRTITSISSFRRQPIQQHSQRHISIISRLDSEINTPQEKKVPIRYNTHREPTIKIGTVLFDITLLRDACSCPECMDPSTTQKNFRTTDIACEEWKAQTVDVGPTHTKIRWKKKQTSGQHIKEQDELHVSTFTNDLLDPASALSHLRRDDSTLPSKERSWDASNIGRRLKFFDYKDYMTSEEALHQALKSLANEGFIIVKDVPESEKSVEEIAGRIGSIRDTFYGRTWDVKSVPDAKNVAYTSKYLGLHMDLLYMANPPGFQLLHCLKNTAKGGDSIFSDCKQAATQLTLEQYKVLCLTPVAYHYKNAGEHYHYSHPVIESVNPAEFRKGTPARHFNYSPPFQAPYPLRNPRKTPSGFLDALSAFSSLVEDPKNIFSHKLKEGECVVFNNRRILHGRQSFDVEGGERWLKGTYVDTDVVASRLRVLNAKFSVGSRRLDSEEDDGEY